LNRSLHELARLYGIQISYIDMKGERRHAHPEALLLVLRAMGAAIDRIDDAPEALRHRKDALRKRTTERVMVAWDGKLGQLRFEFGYHEVEMKGQPVFVISAPQRAYFPGSEVQSDIERQFEAEVPLPPGEGARRAGEGRNGETFRRRRPHPALRATLSRREKDSLLGKSRLPNAHPRLWGIFAPTYALHSKRNPFAGDLTDFENFMDWISSMGGSVAATLPLLGAFLKEPFEPSPYSPATRLFWNEFYIDLHRIPEFHGQAALEASKRTRLVDYCSVMAHKRRVLEELSMRFFSKGTRDRIHAFQKFVRENKGVEDYAKFRAVTDRQRMGWHAWPARLRDGTIRKGDYDEAAKSYHLYSQWIIQEQLAALAQRAASHGQFLYLDLPLGLHRESYDVWRDRHLFVEGVAGGAPPDPVFSKGQNWCFPPMNPEAMRLNRYQYVIAYLRNHLRYARLLRIDHVMGLHRLYWIPDGLTGDKGVYVEYPAEELWAILSLESHRHRAGIVGENLGTVPPAVNTAMLKHDIRQMYVVQYEVMGNPDKPSLASPPEKCVASLNTHDMAPFRAFLDGTDIDDRVNLAFLDEADSRIERRQRMKMKAAMERLNSFERKHSVVRDRASFAKKGFTQVLQFLSNSMANIVLVNVEDLWEETLPQNVPATTTERPNWRRRVRPSLERIRKMAGLAEVLSNVFAQRSRSLPV
jgi:4-alpha-glucanotransferase